MGRSSSTLRRSARNLTIALAGLAIREIPPPVPGFTVVQTANSTQVSETGTTDTFTVTAEHAADIERRRERQPAATSREATVSPATLTFTNANWNVPQTVTVTGADDALDDGDIVSNITLSINDGASDDTYDPLADLAVQVTTVDR